ncbi:rhodanese-like domain-containing protein [bacterium]|nr:rhodanese-like domain-containing protein [bacterium]
MKLTSNKWLRRTIDVSVVVVVIGFLVFGYFKYTKTDTTFTGQLSRQEVQAILLKEYQDSSISPNIGTGSLQLLMRKTRELPAEWLSRSKFFSTILAKNRIDRIGLSTQSCEDSCGGVNEGYAYPIPINQSELRKLQIETPKTKYPDLIILDVRGEQAYLESHIPGAVYVPMTEIVETVFPMNRWLPIVVVGNNYEETRIASEALYRMLFHFVYRFQYPYPYWNGEKETFLANGI